MGGGGTETTTQTSGPTNPMVDSTTTKLLSGLQGQVDKGTAVFDKSLYPGMSGTTTGGIGSLTSAASAGAPGLNNAYGWANGVVNSGGYNPALTSAQTGVQDFLRESRADAPGYAAVRRGVADDTLRDVGSSFLTDGRFGSSVMGESAGEGLGKVLGAMDMQNYENRLGRMLDGNQALAGIGQTAMGNAAGAASAVPSLYGATLMPGQTQIAAGQLLDADALAARQGEDDLFRRQNDSGWSTLGQATSILAGNAGAGTQQQTQTQPTAPWWQQALGAGAIGSGIYKNVWGS
jgi:hypothetical protein